MISDLAPTTPRREARAPRSALSGAPTPWSLFFADAIAATRAADGEGTAPAGPVPAEASLDQAAPDQAAPAEAAPAVRPLHRHWAPRRAAATPRHAA